MITEPTEFLHRVNYDMTFDNYEVHGTLLHLQFKTTDRMKKLVSLTIGGFTECIQDSEMQKLLADVKDKLSSEGSLQLRQEMFTCTVWGELEESCTLQTGQVYSFKNMRKTRNWEGTACFDCLIQNISQIKY